MPPPLLLLNYFTAQVDMASLVAPSLDPLQREIPHARAPLSFSLLHFRVRLRFAGECDGGGGDASESLVAIVLVKDPVGAAAGSVID